MSGVCHRISAECGDQQLYANTESVSSKISVVDLPNYVKENSLYFKRMFEVRNLNVSSLQL